MCLQYTKVPWQICNGTSADTDVAEDRKFENHCTKILKVTCLPHFRSLLSKKQTYFPFLTAKNPVAPHNLTHLNKPWIVSSFNLQPRQWLDYFTSTADFNDSVFQNLLFYFRHLVLLLKQVQRNLWKYLLHFLSHLFELFNWIPSWDKHIYLFNILSSLFFKSPSFLPLGRI